MTVLPPSSTVIQQSVAKYFEATRSQDSQIWASCFAQNATVEDPIGSEPITGSEAIIAQGEAFLEGFESVGLEEKFLHIVGFEAVTFWIGRGVTKEGKNVRFEGINIFRFDSYGQILNLKGYWNPNNMIEESSD